MASENGSGPRVPPIEEDRVFNGTAVMRTTRITFSLIGAVGLILTSLGTPPASAGRAAPAAAAVSWSRVTPVGTNIIDDIGLSRGNDGVLHVLWKTDASSNPQILDFPVSPTGTVGTPATVARFFLASDPDATVTPTGIAALWNGASQETGGTQGAFEATRPLSGGHWAMTAHVPPAQNVVWSSLTVTATTGSDGKPWSAFTGTDSLAVVHFPHGMVQLGPANMCCVDMPGLGTDGSTGSTWVTYSSLISKHEGIFARKLLASGQPAGPATHLPGSSVGGLSVQPEQRVATTGRGHGHAGVYAAYVNGYPSPRTLLVNPLGSGTTMKVASAGGSEEIGGTALTADSGGRLVAAWFFGRGTKPALFVARSNLAATKFGAAERIPLPAGTTTVWKVYVNAQASMLDVLVLASKSGSSNNAAYWSAQVAPPA